MNVIKLPQSRFRRDLNSLFRKLETGMIDIVEVTKNGRGIVCLVRYDGEYQPPRETLDCEAHDDDQLTKIVSERLSDCEIEVKIDDL